MMTVKVSILEIGRVQVPNYMYVRIFSMHYVKTVLTAFMLQSSLVSVLFTLPLCFYYCCYFVDVFVPNVSTQ